ncbi:fibrinogen-like 2a [Hemibagrus wyckioides]|uniref:fibrinogen-like 2a n=1 Tax=Hemibagrus wyckioides TaxID=337641 RepID=UPI00266BE08A|nr:fibrinogen-like 2a [Hemibagrus wyckioides]
MLLCVYIILLAANLGSEAVVSGSVEKKLASESCSQVKLKPAGQCGNEEECPYQITIPPLTIQLPKQFQLLKKVMTELESMKETVRQLKSACLSCSLQRDSTETQNRGDGETTTPKNESSRDIIREMQVKMSKMSSGLKNAHIRIKDLRGQVELLSHFNMNNVKEMMGQKVDNISELSIKFNRNCSNECPVVTGPQYIIAARDCSDYSAMKNMKNGVYKVTPDHRNGTFEVFCDMESNGGGWTVVQHRINGTLNFNRTWADYKNGFGDLRGEFWLGNDHIHLLTRTKDMVLRIELEDFQGVREYAKYEQFYVANEFLKYRLSISKYSGGSAGDALHINNDYNHDQMFFTTWDRDNDMYLSGNCGAYYGSGWWFNACMSANLNGKYYHKRYTGKRNGIFWSTWPNTPKEQYLTNGRHPFKTVKMMIRPKNYAP